MKNILVASIVGLIFVFHFGATALYLLPANPLTNLYSQSVSAYMDPIFTQNWNLFAPEPATSSLKMWHSCSDDKSWTQWQDPIHSLIKKHQDNRFTYRGKLIYIYQNLSRSLLNQFVTEQKDKPCSSIECFAKVEEKVKRSPEYKMTANLISDLCKRRLGTSAKYAKFQILKVFPKNYSDRFSDKPYGKIETVPFTKFKL